MRLITIILIFALGPIMAFMPDNVEDQDPFTNDTTKFADTFSLYLSECLPFGWSYEVIKENPEKPKYYKQPIFIIKYWLEVVQDSAVDDKPMLSKLRKQDRTEVNLYFYYRGDSKLIEQEIYLRQNEHYNVHNDIPKRLANSKDLTCFYDSKVIYKTEEEKQKVVPQFNAFIQCIREIVPLL